jgi:hypothetical protein
VAVALHTHEHHNVYLHLFSRWFLAIILFYINVSLSPSRQWLCCDQLMQLRAMVDMSRSRTVTGYDDRAVWEHDGPEEDFIA